MTKKGLPEKVCVLDLEMETVSFQNPEESRLAFVGTQVYSLDNGRYRPCRPHFFFPEDLHELKAFLQSFGGVLIGHNILQFDYAVLRMYFPDELISMTVVDKMVDTLYFLYIRNEGAFEGSLQGLSLDDLAKANFGYGKTIHSKTIPLLWRSGQKEKVFRHNEEDLKLTFKLWWHLIKVCKVLTGVGRSIELTDEDVARLTGERPLTRTRMVMVKNGPPLGIPYPASWFELEKDSVEPYVRMGAPVELTEEEEDAWP